MSWTPICNWWAATPCPHKCPEHCKGVTYKVSLPHTYWLLILGICDLSFNSFIRDTTWVPILEAGGLHGLRSASGPRVKLTLSCRNGWLHPHNFGNEKTTKEPEAPGAQGQQCDITLSDVGTTRTCVNHSQLTQLLFVLIGMEKESKARYSHLSPLGFDDVCVIFETC